MADKKPTDLPELSVSDDGDYIIIHDTSAGTTKKIKISGLRIGPTQRTGGAAIGDLPVDAVGNVSITGLGFKPKVVEFWVAVNSSSGATQPASLGHGMMTETAQRAVSIGGRASTTHGNYSRTYSSSCIQGLSMGTDGIVNSAVVGTYVSMDNDGFTVNISVANSGLSCQYKATA